MFLKVLTFWGVLMTQLKLLKSTLLVAMTLLLSSCQQYQIQPIDPIHSFHEVGFASIEPGTLVIFDVDETLIQPVDTYLINEHTQMAKDFKKGFFQNHPEVKNWDELGEIMLVEAKRPLLEPMISNEVRDLKNRGIVVIACTGMNTGAYGKIKSLEEWRYSHLKSLGFEASIGNLVFTLKGFKGTPGFYKGILSTDLEPKGLVLGAVFDRIGLHPQKVVMIDDTLEGALYSVQKECEKRGIPFQGYQYKGFKEKPWDEALVQFQGDYLIKHKKWLSDIDARKISKL